jgi:hypothetical protein
VTLKEKEVRLLILYNFNKSAREAKSHKLEVMIHTNSMKYQKYIEMEPEQIEFGNSSFNVYSNTIKILEDYQKKF